MTRICFHRGLDRQEHEIACFLCVSEDGEVFVEQEQYSDDTGAFSASLDVKRLSLRDYFSGYRGSAEEGLVSLIGNLVLIYTKSRQVPSGSAR